MAVRITLDPDRCTGHGRCYAVAPVVFGADDGGYGTVLSAEVAAADEDDARRGAINCPEDAISIED